MEFDLTPEQEEFRAELCGFLQRELTDEVRWANRDLNEQDGWSVEFTKQFRRRLGEAGYLGISWPAEYGGGGKDMLFQTIFVEEMEYHRAPGLDRSITYVPQAIATYGSEEQKAMFLPRLRRGEIAFFVGYSEPEAGSDLASLQTRAEDHGDYFVITGQKAYSSGAHMADYGWVAVRTDPDAPKHRGISLFIVDMKIPSIHITTHRTVAGWQHHSVYFDRVRVPRSMLVGELNMGWRIIMGAIDLERAALAAPGLVRFQLDRLIAHCLRPETGTSLDDATVVDRLVRLAVEVEAARLLSYWVASMHAHGKAPQHETSLAVLYKRETARQADVIGVELLGPFAPLHEGPSWSPLAGEVEREYRDHLYFHFAAGGFDITRNVIAVRGLGLPR